MADEIVAKDLTGMKVSQIYGGLLHYPNSLKGVEGVQQVYDGYGNESALKVGSKNYGISVTGDVVTDSKLIAKGDLELYGDLSLFGGCSANDLYIYPKDNEVSLNAKNSVQAGKLRVKDSSTDYELIFGNPNATNKNLFSIIVKSDVGDNSSGNLSHLYIKNNYADPDSASPFWINRSTGEVNVKKLSVDTLNVNTFTGGSPVGMIAMFPSLTIPTGWKECNGDSLSTTDYANLFSVLQYAYGGSGSTFKVPDLRGLFVRGLDRGKNVDPDGSGRAIGSVQIDQVTQITGGLAPIKGATDGGSEVRPKNMALIYCIKY